jgi:hypothetical protein
MWRFLLALIVLASAGGGAWWLVNEAPEQAEAAAPADERALLPAAASAANVELEQDTGLAASSAAPERNAAPPAPAPPEPQGIEDGAGAPEPELDFGWKYGGWSEAELKARLATLESELQLALDREFLPRFEQGRFDERRVARDDKRSVQEVLAEHGADDPLCRVWPVFDPASASGPTAEQRLLSVRVVCLSRSEFAGLAAQADERRWLRGRLASDPK